MDSQQVLYNRTIRYMQAIFILFWICGCFFTVSLQATTYSCTNAAELLTVPDNVNSMIIEGYGGAGGNSLADGVGGSAGYISATCYIPAGTVLQINVGCFGQSSTESNHYAGVGGFNGGGAGGAGAGGGGGATDIRIGGLEVVNRFIVASGGGGAGDYAASTGNNGGAGGGQIGLPGYENSLGDAGMGGEQSTGGEGGCFYYCGSYGGYGNGGTGAQSEQTRGGGGGGGSGYYGGGGGGNGYGGGGGSSYASTTYCTDIVYTTSTSGPSSGDGSLTITFIASPSSAPTSIPSSKPTSKPSSKPTDIPSAQPSTMPSSLPTNSPSTAPTTQPSTIPSSSPTCSPSHQPTTQPSSQPSSYPSCQPSSCPTTQPSNQPTNRPSLQPSSIPSSQPSRQPSTQPTSSPTSIPTTRPSFAPINAEDSNFAAVPLVFMVFANFFARLLRRGHEDSLNEVSPLIVQILHVGINGASWFLFLQTFFIYYNEALNQGNYSTQWLANLLIASKLPMFLAWFGFLLLLFAPKTAAWLFSCGRTSSSYNITSTPGVDGLESGGDSSTNDVKKQEKPLRMYLNARIISPAYTIAGVSATTFCGLVILGSIFDLYALRYLPWNRTPQTKILRAFPTKSMVRLCLYSTALSASLQAFASLAIFVEQDQKSLTGAFFIGLSVVSAITVALDVLMMMVMSNVSLQADVRQHHKEKIPEILEEMLTLLELHEDYEERERMFSMAVFDDSSSIASSHSLMSFSSPTVSETFSISSSSMSLSQQGFIIRASMYTSPLYKSFASFVHPADTWTEEIHAFAIFSNKRHQINPLQQQKQAATLSLMLSTARKLRLRGQSSGLNLQEHYQRLLFPDFSGMNDPNNDTTTDNAAMKATLKEENILQLMSLATAQLNEGVLTQQSHANIALDYWFKHDHREVLPLLSILAQEDDMSITQEPQTNKIVSYENDSKRLDVQFYRNVLEDAQVNNVPQYRPWSQLQQEAAEWLLACCGGSSFSPILDNTSMQEEVSPIHQREISLVNHNTDNTNNITNNINKNISTDANTINTNNIVSSTASSTKEMSLEDKERHFEDLLIALSFHPVFRAEVRLATLVWERQEHVFLRACFLQTVSFIPPIFSFVNTSSSNKSTLSSFHGIFQNHTNDATNKVSDKDHANDATYYKRRSKDLEHASELVISMSPWRMFTHLWSHTSYASTYSYSFAQRIANRPALWLLRISPKMIDCLLTVSDLTAPQGKFNPLSQVHADLDLIELAAIYFALPDHFTPEYDLDGKKQRWKTRVLTHLRHRLRLQRDELLQHLKREKQRRRKEKHETGESNSSRHTNWRKTTLNNVRKSLFLGGRNGKNAEETDETDDDTIDNNINTTNKNYNKTNNNTNNNIDEGEEEVDSSAVSKLRATVQSEKDKESKDKQRSISQMSDISDRSGASASLFSFSSQNTNNNTNNNTNKNNNNSKNNKISFKKKKISDNSFPKNAKLRHPIYSLWPGAHGPHSLLPDWLALSLEMAEAETEKLAEETLKSEDFYDENTIANNNSLYHEDSRFSYRNSNLFTDIGDVSRHREESRDLLLRDRILSTSGWFTYQSPLKNLKNRVQLHPTASRNVSIDINKNTNNIHNNNGPLSELSLRFSDIYAMTRPSTFFPPPQAEIWESEIEMDKIPPQTVQEMNDNTINDSNAANNHTNNATINNNFVTEKNPLNNKRRPSQLPVSNATKIDDLRPIRGELSVDNDTL